MDQQSWPCVLAQNLTFNTSVGTNSPFQWRMDDPCTDDSAVKEQEACHQRHHNLCEPSSGEALLRDEPLWRGVGFGFLFGAVDTSLRGSFCKQAAVLL